LNYANKGEAMDTKRIVKELEAIALEAKTASRGYFEAQEVIQETKPVFKALSELRDAMRGDGDARGADSMFLEANGHINELIALMKQYR
jgi:hypothetical protein